MKILKLLLLLFISIRVQAQIPNADFENWTDFLPDDWETNSCPECKSPFERYIVRKDSNSYQGKYDANFIYNNVFKAWAEAKFSLKLHPQTLNAYVKYTIAPCSDDTVSIKVTLFNKDIIVDSGSWIGTNSILDYQLVTLPITQHSSVVDSAMITITGGGRSESCGGAAPTGTDFYVDHLFFNFLTTEVQNERGKMNLEIYPMPSKDGVFNLRLSQNGLAGKQITVINSLGKIVYIKELTGIQDNQMEIDISSQASGVYMFQLKSVNSVQSQKLILTKEF